MENFAGLAWRNCEFFVKIGICLAVSSVVIVLVQNYLLLVAEFFRVYV
jgi:hypothetical protein